jgi:hypothetical protein
MAQAQQISRDLPRIGLRGHAKLWPTLVLGALLLWASSGYWSRWSYVDTDSAYQTTYNRSVGAGNSTSVADDDAKANALMQPLIGILLISLLAFGSAGLLVQIGASVFWPKPKHGE